MDRVAHRLRDARPSCCTLAIVASPRARPSLNEINRGTMRALVFSAALPLSALLASCSDSHATCELPDAEMVDAGPTCLEVPTPTIMQLQPDRQITGAEVVVVGWGMFGRRADGAPYAPGDVLDDGTSVRLNKGTESIGVGPVTVLERDRWCRDRIMFVMPPRTGTSWGSEEEVQLAVTRGGSSDSEPFTYLD
nr:hypothetical protein [Sandaracinus sp.]